MMTKAKPMTPKSQASTPKGNLKGVKNSPIGKNKTPKFKATPTGKVSLINGTPKNAGNNTPKGKQNSPAFTPKNKQGNGKAFTPSNKQNTPQGKKNTPKGQKSPKSPGQKSPLTEEQLRLKAAQIIGKVDDEDESDDSDEDINEGVEINEEVSDEEADSDAEEESGDDGITGILGNSLADDSDDDDEDFDDDDDDDEEVENKGIKKFKGLNQPSLADEEDDEEDDDSSGDDDEDSLNNSGPGLKALLGHSLADDDDDEDFTDNDEEDDDDDDISDDEEDEELESSPVKKQKQVAEDDDDDEDEEEDDDSEEAEDDAETSKLSILEDNSDEDEEENASDEELDASKDDSADHDNLLTPEERTEREKRSIYVGNLPKDVQKSKVLTLFKQFGPIEAVRIRGAVGKDAKTSKKLAAIKRDELHPDVPALHAYVRFTKEPAAKKALALNGHKMDDFYLRVDLASGDAPKPDTKKAVFLGNLSFKLDDNSVWAHFADCGKITSVRIVRDRKTGMGKGFGYVNFETTDAVALALKLNGTSLLEREIRVQLCSDKPQKKQRTGGQKRPHPNSNKGGSPKKLKDGSGDAVSVATRNSQNAERRKDKRSQGEQQRQTGNGKPGFKQGGGGFQGQKADNQKKPKFNKFDKKKKQVAAKFAAKPRKPTAE